MTSTFTNIRMAVLAASTVLGAVAIGNAQSFIMEPPAAPGKLVDLDGRTTWKGE